MHQTSSNLSTRDDLKQAFLSQTSWHDAKQIILPSDASRRNYIRLEKEGRLDKEGHLDKERKTALLMDMPPPEKFKEFLHIDHILQKAGLSSPRIFASSDDGFAIIEDFGTHTFTNVLEHSPLFDTEIILYNHAIDTLVVLHHNIPSSCKDEIPPYDIKALQTELSIFLEWFPLLSKEYAEQHHAGLSHKMPLQESENPLSKDAQEAFLSLWIEHFKSLQDLPQTLVLRDYHVDNLVLLDRPQPLTCGLLDFQDALWGSPLYDIASLLEDARRDVSPHLISPLIQRYLKHFPDISQDVFLKHLDILALQRSLKILGIFTRLSKRDHKHHYMIHLPRVYHYVFKHLQKESFHDIKEWFATFMPFMLHHD